MAAAPGRRGRHQRRHRLAQVVDHVNVEPQWVVDGEHRRERIDHDDHRSAGLGDRTPGDLGLALVVEHRRREDRPRVGQPREAEAAGRPVLEPAQRLDVVTEQVGLVALRGGAPGAERRMVLCRHPRQHHVDVESVVGGEVVPVETRASASVST